MRFDDFVCIFLIECEKIILCEANQTQRKFSENSIF